MPALSTSGGSNLNALTFDGVGKRYRLGSGHRSLRGLLTSTWDRSESGAAAELWALRDVSFQVKRGQTVGLVGANGAGKTTSLKLMSRVSWATEGQVTVAGKVAALIELGAGFHPELTGRENVYLNGAVLGLTRAEIRRQYPKIVEFAELDRFMDTPVKRYSSGMYARLAFAVAAHVDPDILLVDEVLSVGDQSFQRKCYDFMREFVKSGRTTVFVSHNLYALEQLCDRLIWLESGEVVDQGDPKNILNQYFNKQDQSLLEIDQTSHSGQAISFHRVYTSSDGETPQAEFGLGQDVWVSIECSVRQPLKSPHFAVAIWTAETQIALVKATMLSMPDTAKSIENSATITCRFKSPPLMPRTYHLWAEVFGSDRRTLLMPWQLIGSFKVVPDGASDTGAFVSIRDTRSDGPIFVQHEWEVLESV